MKGILQNLGSGKADEMQRLILLKAQRNGYVFLALALLGWSLWESYGVYARQEPLNVTPCGLLIGAVLIQSFSQIVLTRRATEGDEESSKTGRLIASVLLICATAAAAAAGAAFLLAARS